MRKFGFLLVYAVNYSCNRILYPNGVIKNTYPNFCLLRVFFPSLLIASQYSLEDCLVWRFCCDTFVIMGNTLWYYSIVIYAVIPNCKATLQPISLVSAEVSKPVLKRNMAHLIWNTQNTRHHRVSGITCCICHQLSLSCTHASIQKNTHTKRKQWQISTHKHS